MRQVELDVVVTARHLDLDDALKEVARSKVGRLGRFLGGMERAEVCFSRTPTGHLGDPVTCEIVLEGHGHAVRAGGSGNRPAAALDAALEKAELQLTRLKVKLVERSRPRHGSASRHLEGSEGPFEGITEL